MSRLNPLFDIETWPQTTAPPRRWLARCLASLGLAASLGAPPLLPLASAGTADLTNIPLGLTTSNGKSNIMFILDDSGSMDNDFMPDEIEGYWSSYGYRSSQCNGVAYNPNTVYAPPVYADGTSYPNATYTAAWNNGYDTAAGTTNLSDAGQGFLYYYRYAGANAALDWRYTADGNPDMSTAFFQECTSAIGTAPGNTTFRAVATNTLPATGTAAAPNSRQNYANWFSYYRKRILTMRSAAGRAFAGLDSNYRVGFTRINDFDPVNTSTSFLNTQDFDLAQKNRFYTLLYGTPASNGTPLRQTLAKIGQYYGKALPGQNFDPLANSATDPTLNSCRRNYAVLSTDGYWNGAVGTQLDGSTAIGQQDGTEARPMRDSTVTTGSPPVTSGGDSNSLADVAEYYYKTDLRPDIANGNLRVVSGSRDTATWQHMTTFTLGLGVKGTLTYDKNYLTQSSGDYVDLTTGTKQWPVPAGTLNPPSPENATHVDDLWHAAVNGRGQYFSAQNPDDLSNGLQTAFTAISRESASGSAAASSSLKPVSGGDDLVFIPSFSPATWTGDLRAYHLSYDASQSISGINTTQGAELWSARARLDAQATRNVWFNKAGAQTRFTYANLPPSLQTLFNNRCASGAQLAQCGVLTAAARAQVTGANLVSYLAGDRTLEITASGGDNSVFRRRDSRLGDIADASPVYVAAPPYRYADNGYAAFASGNANRKRVIYQAANDGMLHAFATGTSATVLQPDATGGTELWAFVPTLAMNEMWRLADTAFDGDHRYLVNATPVVGDVYDSSTASWRTILVGGLGKGGRGYYALDITDPDAPRVLWEISNTTPGFTNLGYSYGNPVITKLKSGTWTVIFSSGVNNVGPGDGVGYVYLVDAMTGGNPRAISTTVGTPGTPSNLVRLNAWIENDTNNLALRLYGGDMLGNFWRIDHDDNLAPAGAGATLMGVAQTPAGGIQPITVMPTLLELPVNGIATPVVTFGTGRYLGLSDLSDSAVQSIYVLKDTLGVAASTATPLLGVLRSADANLVQQSMNADHEISAPSAFSWANRNGWFVDLDQSPRERINVDPTFIQGSRVAYASTIPDGAVCPAGGSAYVYSFDILGGGFSKVTMLSGTTIVGLTALIDSKANGGLGGIKLLGTVSDQSARTWDAGGLPSSIGTTVKRSAWREIVD